MKVFVLCFFIVIFGTGCSDFMKDFLEIDKEEADLPSRPDNEETRNTKVDVQAHSGSTRTVGTASSTVMKTQYYKKTATSSGLSMTMSISAQTRAE